jgi:hypothetical protein
MDLAMTLTRAFASAICLASLCGPAKADSAAYDRTLDSLERMVVEYEKVAVKDLVCLSDVNAMNINLIPALSKVGDDLQKVQASGYQPGPAQLQRYLTINGRMQKAMMQFGTRMKSAKMDC